jgi:AbiV family abortive infection protein
MMKPIQKQSEEIERLLARLGVGQNPKRPLSIDETAEGLTACYLNALALLDDARLLAANGRIPRALSLTILSLEELAKIPDLFELFLDPNTQTDATAWVEFWKRFSQHKPKQRRIAAYGNILRQIANLDELALENPAPYLQYLSENAYGHFDIVKQRNFYVDFVANQFLCPEATKEVSKALDWLFSFAEERADSFGSWHITPQRSLDHLTAVIKANSSTLTELPDMNRRIKSLNEWASSQLPLEADADLLRLLCYSSSAFVPNYNRFFSECETFLSGRAAHERVELLKRAVGKLRQRMNIEILQRSRRRSYNMFKLLVSCATRTLSKSESKKLFGIPPSEEAGRHFR